MVAHRLATQTLFSFRKTSSRRQNKPKMVERRQQVHPTASQHHCERFAGAVGDRRLQRRDVLAVACAGLIAHALIDDSKKAPGEQNNGVPRLLPRAKRNRLDPPSGCVLHDQDPERTLADLAPMREIAACSGLTAPSFGSGRLILFHVHPGTGGLNLH